MIPQHGTLELSRSRINHNLSLLRSKCSPETRICATLKANAYGHGVSEILPLLQQQSMSWVCFYTLREALAFDVPGSRVGGYFNLIVLSPLVLSELPMYTELLDRMLARRDLHFRVNITDLTSARLLSKFIAALEPGLKLKIHIQIDTGLTRAGVEPGEAESLALAIAKLPNLQLEGIFAHLSHGDAPNHPTLQQQHDTLMRVALPLKQKFPNLLIHLQNSGGAFHIQDPNLNMVRVGIALYGLQPSTAHPIVGLQPIAKLTAPILAIHNRPANTGVGYGHTFTTTRQSRLAIVPVGYADGYPRQLSNTKNAVVQLHNATAPVVGRVSMDQIIIDITDNPAAQIGDTVTVISNNPADPNSLDQMADAIGTLNYELATHFGERLQRVIVD